MTKITLTFIFLFTSLCAFSASSEDIDTIRTKSLDEVIVSASYLTREDDHILAVPTKEQRKHAVTGYDLLSNLMIPGIYVNRSTGSVATPAGAATVYIDGREADFREVQSLRPKDIARVEYFDIPTGKYAKTLLQSILYLKHSITVDIHSLMPRKVSAIFTVIIT